MGVVSPLSLFPPNNNTLIKAGIIGVLKREKEERDIGPTHSLIGTAGTNFKN